MLIGIILLTSKTNDVKPVLSVMFLNKQSAGEISYELQDPAFCFSVLEVPDDICALTSSITARLSEVEKCKVGVIQDDMPAYQKRTRTRIVIMPLKQISVMTVHYQVAVIHHGNVLLIYQDHNSCEGCEVLLGSSHR